MSPTLAKNIQLWGIDRLKPYERNARTHSDEQVRKVAASITEFGFTNPILVDKDDGIIAGHGRLLAARELGLTEVPVIVLDHLTDAQRRAYIIADNKLAELAGWDTATLAEEIASLMDEAFEVDLLGFSESELSALLPNERDVEDGFEGDAGQDEYEPANTQGVIGPYRFEIPRAVFKRWEESIVQSVGFDKNDIVEEIKKRLVLSC